MREERRKKKQRTRNTHANSRTQDYKGARDVRHTLRRGQTRKKQKKNKRKKDEREWPREREKEKKEKRDCRPNETLGWLSHTRNTDRTTTTREHARTQLVRLANRRRDGKMKLYLVAPRAKPQLRGQHSKQLEVISSRVFYFIFFFSFFFFLLLLFFSFGCSVVYIYLSLSLSFSFLFHLHDFVYSVLSFSLSLFSYSSSYLPTLPTKQPVA
jgi:hypothetical protein